MSEHPAGVVCDVIGGPLDGLRARARMVLCRCCNSEVLMISGPILDPDLRAAIEEKPLGEYLAGYVLDDVLKRLTWSPDGP